MLIYLEGGCGCRAEQIQREPGSHVLLCAGWRISLKYRKSLSSLQVQTALSLGALLYRLLARSQYEYIVLPLPYSSWFVLCCDARD